MGWRGGEGGRGLGHRQARQTLKHAFPRRLLGEERQEQGAGAGRDERRGCSTGLRLPLSGSRRRAETSRPGGTRGPSHPAERGAAGERGGVIPGAPAAERERAGGRRARAGSGRLCGSAGWGSAAQSRRRLLLQAASREASPTLSQHFPAVSDTPLRTARTIQPGSRTHSQKKKKNSIKKKKRNGEDCGRSLSAQP